MPDLIDRELILQHKIALLNRLSNFYQVSSFFFALKNDIIITANDQYTEEGSEEVHNDMGRILAERIKRIVENARLLEEGEGDSDESARKKADLKRKLVKLSKDMD
ncbi:hypothetical protein [Limisalsivibrio acetivorans]|uniref:hypothetical protein n=1 Tax=Limisalsivibrio acetivorans TaxID=1304888 RepID=UPI0003B78583|nr:hypothetical protein [Limisalsivibrio acetivorans]